MTNRYPFPLPFGWFCVGYPEDFPVGEARPLYYMARHLVGWRDHDGEVHVNDAFCPHLGAHLGHGGHVEGCELVCPFHAWQYDAEGHNTRIPYSNRTNRKARLRPYPTVERNGVVLAWFHPHDEPPRWEIPEVPELNDPDWSTLIRTAHEIDASVQEMAENSVDSAHFRYVHNTATVPVLEEYTTGFPEAIMRSSQKFRTPRGVVEGRLETHAWGPGMSLVSFSGIVDTLNYAVTTPIDADRCIVRFNFRFKTMGDEETTRNVGRAFVAEVDKQVLEDKPIWEHKAHLVRPALADGDGPFMKFRKWFSAFYAEEVADERLVYPPPYWPDRLDDAPRKATAAARYTGPES